ncbi:MAG: HAD hydrolase family protein, partial [Vibrio gallaecicus]
MPQQNIKFIAADMDGTLLNEHGKLDPEFFNLYERLEAQDIIFAAASGRQYYSLMETFAPLKDRMMFVAENGTLVMHKGQELYSCLLDTDAIKDIIKEARA